MAEQTVAERTQHPTPRKLQKARQKGHVPESREMSSVATLLILIIMLALLGPNLLQWMETEIKEGFSAEHSVFANPSIFINFIGKKIIGLILITAPIICALTAGSVLAGIAVSGLNFAPGALELKFNQLNPVEGLQKLINGRSIVRLLISILKLFFVSLIVWFYIKNKLDAFADLRWAWSGQMMAMISKIILGLLIRVGIALLIISLADVLYQKWKYIHDLKMTRQEVKQDHKDTEGSPEVKRRVRTIQFQMSLRRSLQEVPKATVVLVNPTHYAVALRYDSKTMDAPVMVAKGADHLADKIREIARAYGVPIIRRPELARTIYSTVKPGETIPEDLYVAVAQVLAMIYRLRHKKTTTK
jgi:flagellar biosynthetic protein FlhB